MRRGLAVIALLMAGPAGPAAAQGDCWYFSRRSGDREPFSQCPHLDASGRMTLDARTLRALSFDSRGLATVWTSGFYYVRRDGRAAPVILFDNGPDYFKEGLARTQVDGKIGYIDRRLRAVIPPRYDWGGPFEGGRAAVCNGCTRQPAGAEHWTMTGGLWGAINRRGREVVPLQYRSADELPK